MPLLSFRVLFWGAGDRILSFTHFGDDFLKAFAAEGVEPSFTDEQEAVHARWQIFMGEYSQLLLRITKKNLLIGLFPALLMPRYCHIENRRPGHH
jgi:hypothetical protein